MLRIPSAITSPRPAAESCFTPDKLDEIAAVLAEILRAADARADDLDDVDQLAEAA
jgi:hypothetical protein